MLVSASAKDQWDRKGDTDDTGELLAQQTVDSS